MGEGLFLNIGLKRKQIRHITHDEMREGKSGFTIIRDNIRELKSVLNVKYKARSIENRISSIHGEYILLVRTKHQDFMRKYPGPVVLVRVKSVPVYACGITNSSIINGKSIREAYDESRSMRDGMPGENNSLNNTLNDDGGDNGMVGTSTRNGMLTMTERLLNSGLSFMKNNDGSVMVKTDDGRMYDVVNLTPHDLVLYGQDGRLLVSIPRSGMLLRIIPYDEHVGDVRLGLTSDIRIQVSRLSYSGMQYPYIPRKTEVWIVSSVAVHYAREHGIPSELDGRVILFAPDTSPGMVVRDATGRILGVKGLITV